MNIARQSVLYTQLKKLQDNSKENVQKVKHEADIQEKKNLIMNEFLDQEKNDDTLQDTNEQQQLKYQQELDEVIRFRNKFEKQKLKLEQAFESLVSNQKSDQFNQDSVIGKSLMSQHSMSKAQRTTNSTMMLTQKSYQDPTSIQQALDDVKENFNQIQDQITIQDDNTQYLHQKISELRFGNSKIHKEIQELKTLSDTLDRKFKNLEMREILAYQKNHAAEVNLMQYKKEIDYIKKREDYYLNEKQFTQEEQRSDIKNMQDSISNILIKIDDNRTTEQKQQDKIKELNEKEFELLQKLNDSKFLITYIDVFEKLEKGDGSILQRQSTKHPTVNLFRTDSYQTKNLANDKDSQNYYLDVENEYQRTGSRNKTQMSQQQSHNPDRTMLLSRLNQFYGKHEQGPSTLVDQLIQQFRQMIVFNESLQSSYEELVYQKAIKEAQMEEQREQISKYQDIENSILILERSQILSSEGEEEVLDNANQQFESKLLDLDNPQKQLEIDKNEDQENSKQLKEGQDRGEEGTEVAIASCVNPGDHQLDQKLNTNTSCDENRKEEKKQESEENNNKNNNIGIMKRDLEKSSLEIVQLQQEVLKIDTLTFKILMNLVENLVRVIVMIKLVLQCPSVQDSEFDQFIEEQKKFISAFRVGMSKKRNKNIDKIKFPKELIKPHTPMPQLNSKEQQQGQQTSDINKSKQNQEIENTSKCESDTNENSQVNQIDKYMDVQNFIPFDKEELLELFQEIFYDQQQLGLKWVELIKQDQMIAIFQTKDNLKQYLIQQKIKAHSQEQKGALRSIQKINIIKDDSIRKYQECVKEIFERYQLIIKTVYLKKDEFWENADQQVKNRFEKKVAMPKIEGQGAQKVPMFIKEYTVKICNNITNRFNEDIDIPQPIVEKRKRQNISNSDNQDQINSGDMKNIILKLANSEKKNKMRAATSQGPQSTSLNLLDEYAIQEQKYMQMSEDDYMNYVRNKQKGCASEKEANSILETIPINSEKHQTEKSSQSLTKQPQTLYGQSSYHSFLKQFNDNEKIIWKIRQLENMKHTYDSKSAYIKLNDYIPKKKKSIPDVYYKSRKIETSDDQGIIEEESYQEEKKQKTSFALTKSNSLRHNQTLNAFNSGNADNFSYNAKIAIGGPQTCKNEKNQQMLQPLQKGKQDGNVTNQSGLKKQLNSSASGSMPPIKKMQKKQQQQDYEFSSFNNRASTTSGQQKKTNGLNQVIVKISEHKKIKSASENVKKVKINAISNNDSRHNEDFSGSTQSHFYNKYDQTSELQFYLQNSASPYTTLPYGLVQPLGKDYINNYTLDSDQSHRLNSILVNKNN